MKTSAFNKAATSQSGFTLIEMLVAITLLAVVMGLAYQGLSNGIRAIDRGEEVTDRTNRLRNVQQFLRNQISRALPLAMRSENEDDETELVLFEGYVDRMRFVAPMPGYLGHGGPHEQVLAIDRDRNGYRLLFAHRLLSSFEEGDPLDNRDRPPTVLMDQIDDAHFEYLTLDEEGMPTSWVDEWEDLSVMPVMVRIAMQMDDEARIVWPTLEVAPLIDGATRRRSGSLVVPGGGARNRSSVRPEDLVGGDRQRNNQSNNRGRRGRSGQDGER